MQALWAEPHLAFKGQMAHDRRRAGNQPAGRPPKANGGARAACGLWAAHAEGDACAAFARLGATAGCRLALWAGARRARAPAIDKMAAASLEEAGRDPGDDRHRHPASPPPAARAEWREDVKFMGNPAA